MRYLYRVALLLVSGFAATQQAAACDVCGCSSGNQGLGLLPQFSGHFVGIQYTYGSSLSDHPALFENGQTEHSAQYYNTLQLWGRYQLGKRVQLFAFVPYVSNTNNEGSSMRTTGFGDASVLANISLLQRANGRQLLLAGAGVKLPTGAYHGITDADRQGLPNMQTGTGSYDFLVNANYTWRQRSLGFNADASYTFTTVNKARFKYGNKLNSSALAFYWIERGKFRLVPQAGFRFEYTLHDYDNYDRKWLNEQSGGYMGFVSAGAQAYVGKLGFKAMLHVPVLQDYATGYVTAGPRFESGLFFLL
jgi:hypothetical protein